MTTELREAIARLRAGVHNGQYCGDQSDDVELVCDALEQCDRQLEQCDRQLNLALGMLAVDQRKPKFDKTSYQRQYMRKWRKAKA